jgi:hypothetical protein
VSMLKFDLVNPIGVVFNLAIEAEWNVILPQVRNIGDWEKFFVITEFHHTGLVKSNGVCKQRKKSKLAR